MVQAATTRSYTKTAKALVRHQGNSGAQWPNGSKQAIGRLISKCSKPRSRRGAPA
jgi:hypothetical protein